jgi:flavin-dependent dehydrogenase
MTNAEPLGPLTACADYSYDSRSYVGDNHILVGDAAAFIDPLFSSGVMMAMSSAAFGATVVEGLFGGRQPRERLVRDYERKIRLSLGSLSWLIYRINSPLLRDIFMSPFDLFNTRHELIRILAGVSTSGARCSRRSGACSLPTAACWFSPSLASAWAAAMRRLRAPDSDWANRR